MHRPTASSLISLVCTMAANLPPHSNRMQSILEAAQIIVEDGEAFGLEEVSTLTSTRTREGISASSGATGTLAGAGPRKEITADDYKKSLAVVRLFEEEARRKSELTPVHVAMLRKHVNELFFPRFKFLPTKGCLMHKMKEEMVRVFRSIEVYSFSLMETYAFNMQKKLRFMVSQRRNFVVNRLFDIYKGKCCH